MEIGIPGEAIKVFFIADGIPLDQKQGCGLGFFSPLLETIESRSVHLILKEGFHIGLPPGFYQR